MFNTQSLPVVSKNIIFNIRNLDNVLECNNGSAICKVFVHVVTLPRPSVRLLPFYAKTTKLIWTKFGTKTV